MGKVSVTLSGPAKIDGRREPAGKIVSVTTAVAQQLAANGVIAPATSFDMSDTPLTSDFDAAVAEAVAARTAEIQAQADAQLAAMNEALESAVAAAQGVIEAAAAKTAELEASITAATGRAEEAEAKVAELEAKIAAASTNTGAGKKPADKKA